jgi:uncharacterized protein YndB with AHSA1/START domain
MAVEIDSGINVTITRRFAAPPGRVYRAFVDPDQAAAWMWGANAPNPGAVIDLRVGGRYRVRRDAPVDDDSGWGKDEWAISGVYAEIIPDRRLVYTLHWEGPVGYNQTGDEVLDEVAVVEFAAAEEGTLLTYRHIGIPPDGVSAAEHGKGVDGSFDALANLLEG